MVGVWRRLLWWSSERPAVLPWAVLLSLLLMILGAGVRETLSAAVVRLVYAPFSALHYRIASGADVFSENRNLKERITALQIENQRLREASAENARLRQLLDFAPGWRGKVIAAEVVGPLAPGSGMLWIGAGYRRSVQANWPVVSQDGLLGRVVEVSGDLSRVRTVWDRLLRVAGYDQRSRVTGIVEWTSGVDLHLSYAARSADVARGDTIISSGWGGVFPKGLRIGTVTAVDTLENGEFLDVIIRPLARPDRLEEVFVVEPVSGMLSPSDSGQVP